MKTKNSPVSRLALALIALATLNPQLSTVFAQGTSAFTYHGRLTVGESPANGNYLMYFAMFNTNFGGPLLFSITNTVAVTNGLFAQALDFGSGMFDGSPRWLEIGVSSNGPNALTPLLPRQQTTPTPYAIFAATAGAVQSGSISSSQIAGGQVVKSLNGLKDDLQLLAGANITLSNPSNSNILISATGGSGVFSLNGTNAYYTAGNVGIGTMTPAGKLSVYGGDLTIGGPNSPWATDALIINGNYGSPNAGRIRFGDGTGWKFHFQRRNDNADILTIRDDGNVGIGTSSPAAKLDVRPIAFANNQSGGIQLATTTGQYASGMFLRTDSAGIPRLAFDIASSEILNINNNGGYVGIGTTSPGAPLDIRRSDQAFARIVSGNTENGSVLELWNTTSPDAHCGPDTPNQLIYGAINFGNGISTPGQIAYDGCADSMSFRAGGAPQVYIEPGAVGIGRHPFANRLEVEGNASKTTAGSWLANSDARIKTGVQTISGALQKLSELRLVNFRYTDEYRAAHPAIEDRFYCNVLAQEFRKVFPNEVKSSGEKLPNGDEILQVDTYPLTIYSAAAIQELNRKLEQRVAEKETEITQLKQRLEKIEQLLNHKLNGGAK